MIELPIWVKSFAGLLAFYLPITEFITPIIMLVALDILTGIKASQAEAKVKNVVTSRKTTEKMLLLVPFIVGVTALLYLDGAIVKITSKELNLFGWGISYLLSKVFSLLYILIEVISVLENLDRWGQGKWTPYLKPFINLLRIKSSQIMTKLEENKDEPKE